MARDKWFWLALLLGGVVLSPVLWYGLGMDQAVYAYDAWAWRTHHLLPYVGTWDQNFPGIFIIHRLATTLFGDSILGFRIFDFLAQLSSLAMIFYLAKKLSGSSRAAFFTVIFYGFYYLGRGRWDAGQRDAFVFWILLAAIFFLVALQKHLWLRAVVVGLLAGFAFLIRPTFGLAWIAFGVFILAESISRKRGNTLKEFTVFCLSCLLPPAIVISYYWHAGYLTEMLRAVLWFNFKIYARLRPPEVAVSYPAWILYKLNSLVGSQAVIVFLALSSVLFASGEAGRERPGRGIFWLCLAMIVIGAASYLLLGKDLQYQLIPFWGFVILLSSPGLACLAALPARNRGGIPAAARVWAFYLLVTAFMFASIPYEWTVFAFRHAYRDLDSAYLAGMGVSDQLLSENHYLAAKYLQAQLRPGDEVEVFGAHPLISYLLRKKLPSRFVVVQDLMFSTNRSLTQMQKAWIREYTADVISARPRFFVIAEQGIYFPAALSKQSFKTGLKEAFPELFLFLQNNYRPLKKIGDTEIFELAGQSGRPQEPDPEKR